MSKINSEINAVKGVLFKQKSEPHYNLQQQEPCLELAPYIEQYWSVTWDLSLQKPHIQQNIPSPNVHLVFSQHEQQKNEAYVMGLVSQRFDYELQERGLICGVKFKVGGFFPFYKQAISGLSEKKWQVAEVLPFFDSCKVEVIFSEPSVKTKFTLIEQGLLLHKKKLTNKQQDKLALVQQIIQEIDLNKELRKVDELSQLFDINKRALERLFAEYVGLSAKWVLRKYRMHELLDELETRDLDIQTLVYQLGYYDQAHFIKDFKAMTGLSPQTYINKQT